jgi:hypothetical protein
MAVSGRKAGMHFKSPTLKSSGDGLKVFCLPCDRDGERLAAHGFCKNCHEHLCKSCYKFHKKHTLSRDHKLLNKTNMPHTMPRPSTVRFRQHDYYTKSCPQHKKETIKYFCEDHKTLLCSVCVTLEHQPTYCRVNYIPNISKNTIDGLEYREILKTMTAISIQYHELKDHADKAFVKSNSSLNHVLLDIKEFRKEINQRLDELEVQAERRAHETLRENFKNLNKIETACQEATISIQKSADKIKQFNISKQADELFMELKFAEQMLKEYDKTFADLSNFDIKEYNFKPNETISTLLKQETFLGRLALTALDSESTASVSQIESNQYPCQENEDICVKTSQDRFSCWITGMALLTPELLIITDFLNSAVKVVDTSSQSVSVQLQLDVEPWDITAVTNIELAVTLPHKQVIQFLSISTNTLLKKRQVKVDGDCRGISCYQRKLVVSFNNPVKVQIFQRNGTVLNTIENELFRSPLYITTNNQFIYVSDWKMKTVTILNWQYEEIGNNTSMDDPKGISLSDDGTVFVSDGVRNIIEEMSGDCSAGEVVRKDLKYPFAVCFCSKTRKLYYSCHSGDFKVDNVLTILKVPGKI